MLNDCHIHTHFSSDSTTPPRAQIERAISLGMERAIFTRYANSPNRIPQGY